MDSVPLPGFAHHLDIAALRGEQRTRDGQPQPAPAAAPIAGRFCAVEALEDMRQVLGRDARAVIDDRYPRLFPLAADG